MPIMKYLPRFIEKIHSFNAEMKILYLSEVLPNTLSLIYLKFHAPYIDFWILHIPRVLCDSFSDVYRLLNVCPDLCICINVFFVYPFDYVFLPFCGRHCCIMTSTNDYAAFAFTERVKPQTGEKALQYTLFIGRF